jgi:pyruvate,water dikinase
MVPEGRFKIGFIDMSFMETQKRNRADSDTLKGFAVSPGKVTGTACVIMSPADFEDMESDAILVCPTTTPAWTPLFSQALALVTDIGGILAHGSIVAREYGIPAVMGTGNITQRIVTGQRITVDGGAGTVTILD